MANHDSTRLPRRVKDETGNIYNKLTVLEFTGLRRSNAMWLCRCECGNTIIVSGINLRKHNTKSCGCLHFSQGGGAGTPEHRVWKDMKRRCTNNRRPDYYLYGGRGIVVCDRWRFSFVNFLADMGLRPYPSATIERIDPNGPYSPENCVWVSRDEQARNKRTSQRITYNGETMCVAEWSRRVGIRAATLYYRAKKGWTAHQILTTPAGVARCT